MPRSKHNKADRRPTWTHLTAEALRAADDFMSTEQLLHAVGATLNQLTATLFHLQRATVVDAVEVNGKPYWFLTGNDRRSRVVEERRPEEPGTRRQRRKTD